MKVRGPALSLSTVGAVYDRAVLPIERFKEFGGNPPGSYKTFCIECGRHKRVDECRFVLTYDDLGIPVRR